MRTSTSGDETFVHVGQFRFEVEGHEAVLQVYEQEEGGYFIPFVDATAPPRPMAPVATSMRTATTTERSTLTLTMRTIRSARTTKSVLPFAPRREPSEGPHRSRREKVSPLPRMTLGRHEEKPCLDLQTVRFFRVLKSPKSAAARSSCRQPNRALRRYSDRPRIMLPFLQRATIRVPARE